MGGESPNGGHTHVIKVKIIKIQGGLGNQLFQYAFGELLRRQYDEEVLYDVSFFGQQHINSDSFRQFRVYELGYSAEIVNDNILKKTILLPNRFNVSSRAYKIVNSLERLINNTYYYEKDRAPINVDNILKYRYLDGYWQSWRYVKESCIPVPDFINYSEEQIQDMCDSYDINNSSCFIGIRRGDYTNSDFAKKHFGSFGEDYFNKGIAYLMENANISNFQVFSNDITWVKNNITFKTNNIVFHDKENTDIEEFIMMSRCGNSIIVNSTFYWWASYFIQNPKKIIIAPRRWFFDNKPIDIVPPQWKTIEE